MMVVIGNICCVLAMCHAMFQALYMDYLILQTTLCDTVNFRGTDGEDGVI